MFENIPTPSNQPTNQTNASQSPSGASVPKPAGAVDDIFSQTDTGAPLPAPEKVTPPPALGEAKESAGLDKKYFIIGAIILILALLAGGGAWAFKKYYQPVILPEKNKAPVSENQNQATEQNKEDANKTSNNQEEESAEKVDYLGPPVPEVETPVQPTDTDQDGLTDEEEDALGTDKMNSDTDNDQLFDREEVKVYKTDPKNSDTDQDGYPDGEEVKSGYNPNGSGKLYEIR